MKIKFLGTSFGAPSKGRHQQSILIEDKVGNAYLFVVLDRSVFALRKCVGDTFLAKSGAGGHRSYKLWSPSRANMLHIRSRGRSRFCFI